jgi:fructose-6-phosphate aldolase 2
MLLVDTADSEIIRECLQYPAVRGFTTNPTLMARAAGVDALPIDTYISRAVDLCRLLTMVRSENPVHVMIQLIGSRDQMLGQAQTYLHELKSLDHARLWFKIPPTTEGLVCCPSLKKLDAAILVTAVYTATQAHLAIEAGADGIAVYLGRIMRLEESWRPQVEAIAEIVHGAKKTLLMASFPDVRTVEIALHYSRDLTIPPDVCKCLLHSKHSDDAMETFNAKVLWPGGKA